MNANKKKAAVEKYTKLYATGVAVDELTKDIKADEKGYTDEEVAEIVEAITVPVIAPAETGIVPAVDDNPNALKLFEKHRAKPIFKFRINEDTGVQERYLHTVEKLSAAPLMTTNIEQRHADELNSQVENSGEYYFPVI